MRRFLLVQVGNARSQAHRLGLQLYPDKDHSVLIGAIKAQGAEVDTVLPYAYDAQAADAKANPDSEFNQGLVWNFPAFLYQDHAGRLIGRVEGLSSQTVKPAGVVAKTRQLRQVSLKYTAMLDKANAATGITKAMI